MQQEEEVSRAFKTFLTYYRGWLQTPFTHGLLWLIFWAGWREGGSFNKRRTPSPFWDILAILWFVLFLLYIKLFLL